MKKPVSARITPIAILTNIISRKRAAIGDAAFNAASEAGNKLPFKRAIGLALGEH
jgi:hypothetical protein